MWLWVVREGVDIPNKMFNEWVKHRVIGTPLQRPAEYARHLFALPKRLRHPELRDILMEGWRTPQVIAKATSPDTNCMDVGCHLGSVLREMLRRSPQGKHTAVEPLPYKAEWLRKSYPKVRVVEAAISDSAGDVEFTWNRSRPGFSSLAREGPEGDELEYLKVCTRPLDEIVPADEPIGFMKIDVEGAELMAFRSAKRIMCRGSSDGSIRMCQTLDPCARV